MSLNKISEKPKDYRLREAEEKALMKESGFNDLKGKQTLTPDEALTLVDEVQGAKDEPSVEELRAERHARLEADLGEDTPNQAMAFALEQAFGKDEDMER